MGIESARGIMRRAELAEERVYDESAVIVVMIMMNSGIRKSSPIARVRTLQAFKMLGDRTSRRVGSG